MRFGRADNVKMANRIAVVVHGRLLSRAGADFRRNVGYKRGPPSGFRKWTYRAADLD
jgi:hypothetical protein